MNSKLYFLHLILTFCLLAYLLYTPSSGQKRVAALLLYLNVSGDDQLYDLAIPFPQFDQFIKRNNLSSQRTNISLQILGEFCKVHQSRLVDRAQRTFPAGCCRRGDVFSASLNYCLRKLTTSYGGMPPMQDVLEYISTPQGQQVPTYANLSVYYKPSVGKNGNGRKCPVVEKKRNSTYEFLRSWIAFSHQHKIVWWLAYGSLLGAIRNADFIPYDKDIDISVSTSSEEVFKKYIASQPVHFNRQNITWVRRSVDYCYKDAGIRRACSGVKIHHQLDVCAFCVPTARLVLGDSFMDVFGVSTALLFRDGNTSGTNRPEFGLFDEGLGAPEQHVYPVDTVFPLKTCRFLGLDLPCPQKPEVLLESLYGKNYRTPAWLCNSDTGNWEYFNP